MESALQQKYPRLHDLVERVRTGVGAHRSVTGAKLDAMAVTLAPGEVLYIPPYWFHMATVAGAETSISVNEWSDAEELAQVDESELVALPFEDSWSTRERKSAVAAYAHEFLQEILGESHTSLDLMVETRWVPLLSSTEKGLQGDGKCDDRTDTCIVDHQSPDFTCSVADLQLDSTMQQRFVDLVRNAAEPLKRAMAADIKYGNFIATMLAWNRIEQIALWAVEGRTESIGSFVTQLPHACRQD